MIGSGPVKLALQPEDFRRNRGPPLDTKRKTLVGTAYWLIPHHDSGSDGLELQPEGVEGPLSDKELKNECTSQLISVNDNL